MATAPPRGMWLGEIRLKLSKRLQVTFPRFVEMIRIGEKAFAFIRARIQGRQIDAEGKPLPPLSQRRHRVVVPKDDPHAEGIEEATYWTGPDGVEMVAGWTPRRYASPYAALQKRRGAAPVRDATLTGTLWRSAQVSATTTAAGADVVRLGFRGADHGKRMKVVGKSPSGAPIFRETEWKLYNRDKARLLQYTRRTKSGSADEGSFAFELMALSTAELEGLVADVLSRTRLLAQGA